ncbi:guanylate kinase [Prochlorothrix hollandica]|uniref:Guanylate kinase n=1 Tax=Prochlorothrix hollandica PCC 9006 = CALU 1027 TaxID=317619 RepID=A0A0M2PZA9_PROHO|nr:guanylate kinase [Prochlorothrix hollandica]KKJ01490.1 guanylate kinase [Prochlorothrix hollandica PCC 9006 = CALU 1027]
MGFSRDSQRVVVITGPSGVGKGTLLQQLQQKYPQIHISISATTRSPRAGEVEGQHYFFVSPAEFQTMVTGGELLEWAEFAGNCYGTPRKPVETQVSQGNLVILEIEVEGARQVRQTFPDALQIFVLPPSLGELEKRLRSRGQDSEAAIDRRLDKAKEELAAAPEFDVQVVNDHLPTALATLEMALFGPHDSPGDPLPPEVLHHPEALGDPKALDDSKALEHPPTA